MQKIMKRAVAGLALATACGGIVVPMSAQAGGTGNTVKNCYGVYYNTDWDQKCGSTGASSSGWFYSNADCTSSGDKSLSKYRAKGNKTIVDGSDCTFQVVGVRTTWAP